MLVATLVTLAGWPALPQSGSPKEIHCVSISADEKEVLSSPAKIAEAMNFLLDAGANAVVVPAWTGGTPSFRSAVLHDALGRPMPDRDVLEELAFAAHRAGFEVLARLDPGASADAASRKLLEGVVLEVCTNYDVDGIVGDPAIADLSKAVAAVDPGIVLPKLPPLDAPDPDKGGDRFLSYRLLKEKNGELEETLRSGAWAEPALLPWRGGRIWRRRTEAIDPAAGEGTWSWAQKEGEPQCLLLNGGEHGHAAWTCTPKDAGVYTLFVWIPDRDDQTARATYRITGAKGIPDKVIDASAAASHGWNRLGNLRLEAGRETEIARLVAEESDATRVTAAGVLLPLLNRRAMRP